MNFNNKWIPTSYVIRGKKRMLKLNTFQKEKDVILLGTYYKGKCLTPNGTEEVIKIKSTTTVCQSIKVS